MWPFDEIEEAVESTVDAFADVANDVAGDIGGAVQSVVGTATGMISNLELSDIAGIAGTFLGGPIGGMAGKAIGGLVEGDDWGDIVSGAIGSFATGGMLPGDLGSIANDLLSGGSLLSGAEVFLGSGLGDLGSVASNFLGENVNFDDFGGLVDSFAGTAGRLSELVTGEADGGPGGAPWPLSELIEESGLGSLGGLLGGSGGGDGADGGLGVFGQILEAAGLGGDDGAAGMAGLAGMAGAAGTAGAAGRDGGDDSLFQQILQRAGIDMPSASGGDTTPDQDDDGGDADMFRDILESAGIDTGRPGPDDRRAPQVARDDGPSAPGASGQPTLHDVVGSLAASGGLSEVLARMPQNELADLVLNLARPGQPDPAGGVADRPGYDSDARGGRGADRDDDDILGVGATRLDDDRDTGTTRFDDPLDAGTAGDAPAAADTTGVGSSAGSDFDDDFDLTLPGLAPAAGQDSADALMGSSATDQDDESDFSQAMDATDDVEQSFDDLFDAGS
jgi:hypothetical protein